MENILESRFILKNDPNQNNFVFDNILINKNWLSRPYEYAWSKLFVNKDDVVLDAACGICHPLKFYLADICKEVHACDIDKRILLKKEIEKEVLDVFGPANLALLQMKHLDKIKYSTSSLTNLLYEDKKFNKIFCISVLEHLNDRINNSKTLSKFRYTKIFNTFLNHDIYSSLKEFKRTLKDDGLIILTFDYPRINLNYLKNICHQLGLTFLSQPSFSIPQDALYSKENDLFYFRAVLKKSKV